MTPAPEFYRAAMRELQYTPEQLADVRARVVVEKRARELAWRAAHDSRDNAGAGPLA